MKPLTLNQHYSREEISNICGGTRVGYLPTRKGKVVCGCFDPKRLNPGAPTEVLFGSAANLPKVERTAEQVFRQGQLGESIPVFLKRDPNKWEYVGLYRCVGLSRNQSDIRDRLRKFPRRGKFKGVLTFERVVSDVVPRSFLFVTHEDHGPDQVQYEPKFWWSCGEETQKGDRLLVYVTKIGILYEWRARSKARADQEWKFKCDVEYVRTFDPPITIAQLRGMFSRATWSAPYYNFQVSSILVPEFVANEICGAQTTRPQRPVVHFVEGAPREVTLTRFERDPKARATSLLYHGRRCSVCDMAFGEKYGEDAEGFIHVHHVKPISSARRAHRVNPTTDLFPICPNCHAVIHLTNPPQTIDAVKKLLRRE